MEKTTTPTVSGWFADFGTPKDVVGHRNRRDPLGPGWRVAARFDWQPDWKMVIPVLFGCEADCLRAAQWLNREWPVTTDMSEAECERAFKVRFGGLDSLMREMIPEVCCF